MEYGENGSKFISIEDKNLLALNYESKIMELIIKGTTMKPRLNEGSNCIILVNDTLYELTVDVFKEFFTKI